MKAPAATAILLGNGAATDLLTLHRLNPGRYPCLLESTAVTSGQSRFDILFACPGVAFSASDGNDAGGFLRLLDDEWRREHQPAAPPAGLPFGGGWFLFLAYELNGEIESRLRTAGASHNVPIAMAVPFPAALIRDRTHDALWVVAEPGKEELLDVLRADLALARTWTLPDTRNAALLQRVVEADPKAFLAAMREVKQRIAAGDVYQVNLAREWRGILEDGITPWQIHARLRNTNPSPFAGLAVFDDFAVVSSSPERLVSVRGRTIETRPIAGTRPRRPGQDEAAIAGLLASDKERAEHVMLIDLERNDLGRVCMPGSVEVSEYMTVESYAHVHHIVSNVRGRLRPDATPGDCIRAVFPGGTITGCPKVRSMELIRELEPTPRGAYTGAMGYLNRDGSMDLNILIRSITVVGREVRFSAGSGIVADSDPFHELEETRAKALGMVLALTREVS
jgi:anthranilate synthase component I